MMDIFIALLGSFLVLIAFLSIIVPVIPGGPILTYISVLLWYVLVQSDIPSTSPTAAIGEEVFGIPLLVTLGAFHALALVGDFLFPLVLGKALKFSSTGIWGSFIGMFMGFFIFPPLGIVLGGIIGTLIGELYHETNLKRSLKITGYATLINLSLIILKLILTTVTTYYFIVAVWKYYIG